jgi:CRISPR-associated protein Csm4
MKVSASVRGEEETLPYRIETFSFMSGNGLYILVGYEEKEHLFLLEELLDNLSLSGIGGKRAAGLGRFTLYPGTIPEALEKRLNQESGRYMLLSAALPRREEMQEALNQAEYLLSRRSGFVSSADYAPEYMRKKDLYVLRSGSCVRHRFEGDIYDVSGGQGKHPVYRYAKPMFMGVDA